MKCLNKSLPLVQETLSVLRSEPLAAKVIDMSGSNPTMDDIMRNYYQLASPLTTQANKELDEFLLNFLKPFGVRSKEFESLKQRLGIDALGATDVLNKLIWYNKQRRKDTIPEEAAHMIVMLMGENHSDIKSLLSEIKLWSGYQEVYDKYMPIYNNEKQVKIEAIGKLIAQAMVENYDQYGLDSSLLNKVKQVIKEFFARLDSLFANPLEAYFASKYLADKIAVNVLSGNQNYVANLTNTKEQLDFQKALATNPHAQKIISTFTKDKFKFKLVGSLAIAGQGEKIYRPSSEPIHDLDFIVDNIEDYNDLVNYMDQLGAVPVHNGWKGDNYTTYAYYIPAPGYDVRVTKRKVNGWAEKGEVIEKATGKVVPMTSENVIATDFFVYYTKPDETSIDIFKSWQDIYAGKLRMSPLNSEERLFQREKDQQDYVLSTPNNLTVSRPEFVYYQTDEGKKELDQKIKNFLDKIGVSVEKVNQIRDMNGQPVSAIAKADMLNKIIEIIEGNADLSTLPEEAAHFFVEMLDDNSPLLKEMMDKITSYEIYRETVEQYKNRPEYRLPGGGINFVKLKKEAIGKLVAQAIIRQDQGKETNERLSSLNKWWSKLWEFITKAFSKVEENPFEQVAKQILSADVSSIDTSRSTDGVYYQLDNAVSKLKEEAKLLRLDNSVDPRTGQKRHIYYRGDKAISKNVTTAKVDPYYRSIFRQDKRDERKKQLDLLKAEYGDMIHATIEDIIDSYVDPNTNKRRAAPVASRSKYVGTDFYNTLDSYVRELISSYDPNTIFMREVKIYDPTQDMAGSIDLIAITPDGTVNVYDWKSQEIGKDKKELPSYKEKAYRIQLQEYVNILRNVYGFTKFGKIRAIPIKTNFNYVGKVGEKQLEGLKSVEIAPLDARYTDPDQDYLLPVTLKEETDEDENLAEIIKKLTDLLERFENIASNAKVSERIKMQDQISKYRKAIRDLHLRKDIRTFIELGSIEVDRYGKMLKNNTLSERDALESLDILKIFSGTTFYFKNYMTELRKAMNEEQNPAMKQVYQDILNRYNSLNSNAEITVKEMERAIMQLGKKIAEDKAGVQNLLNAETKIGPIAGLFESLSQIPQRAFKAFYKILRDAQAKRDLLFNNSLATLQTLQKELGDWAKARNISPDKMFDGILDMDEKGNWNGQFLRKHKKEAYKVRKKAIEEADINWVKSNMNFDKTWYEKDLASYTKYVMNMTYNTDPQINAAIQQKTINNWIANHNVTANGDNPAAWLNAQNKYLRFNDTWITDKWKNLQKPENAPLLKVYNEFQKLLRKSENLGMIDEYSWGFIPSIYKDKLDQLAFGGSVFTSKGFFEELEVGTDDKYTPKVDPINGKVLLNIPVHFTKDIGEEKEDGTVDYSQKSKDLFKVFGVWSAQMANYETLSEIEDAANILVHVERNKDQIVTNNWGDVVKKNGVAQTVPDNERNAKLLESFVNFYLYNKMGDNTTDSKFKFRDKEYSANKSLRWFMKFFSLKTLALNPISGTAQFVGGTGNALFTAGKKTIFTTKDWTTSMYQVTKRDPKTIALLHYADILLEDRKDALTNELSVSKIVGFNSLDKLYFIQRFSDKAVQYPVAIATMMNHMVDPNGKIVDITKSVKQEFNYDQVYYNVSEAERKALKEKIDAKVKELKETKSIYATTKIVNDKLEIPGIDISSKDWFAFKSKIKQVNKTIIGNSTRDDINYARTTQLGMAIMQFRSWMPQMVKERFGKLDYNQDLELYNMGKTRLFFGELIKHPMAIAKSIISSSGTDMIQAAKQRYIEERADAALAGKEFNLTEAEFIDLYIGNIRSQLRELAVVVGMLALIFAAKPGDDDEDEERGLRKYITRALEKYYAEFSFYYLPTSFTELVQAPLPVVGLAVDFINFTKASGKQFYGVAVDDTELQEDAKPMKYASRLIPILKEGILMRAIFDDDFRKDWDIRL